MKRTDTSGLPPRFFDFRNNARLAAVVLGALATVSQTPAAETLSEALDETRTFIDWRVRYESVEQDGFADSADAMTSRLRGGFETGAWKSTKLLGELTHSGEILDDYNSTTNGRAQYPVVADPGGFAAVNRFALINDSLANTTLTLGRQRIILDDSRFVGNVGWRQHEQTYDGLRAQIDAAIDVDVAYLTQVNRIFGPDSPAGKWNGDIVLANVSRDLPVGNLTGFAYLLDIDEAAALSSNTFGLRLAGVRELESLKAIYSIAVAEQADAGANPSDYSEHYLFAEGGVELERVTAAAGFERLGSNGTSAVTTPLATLHAFQGWADKFLATPAAGIEDRFVRLGYRFGRVGPLQSLGVTGVFHDYAADAESVDYGRELDLSLVARLERIALTLKYASYDAREHLTDTDKLWLSLDYAF